MLEAVRLTKRWHGRAAANEVSFSARAGEVLGLLGPNGAGKTTTLGMLAGLTVPTRGEIRYGGQSVERDLVAHKRRVGYVPEEPSLYPFLSGREYLQLVGRLRGVPEAVLDEKIDRFLALLALQARQAAPLEVYSKGMRQKVAIAAALLHDPAIVLFDEAESGLDVDSALVLRGLVRALAADGRIVVYCSHVLEAMEKVCTRVVILDQGRVVADEAWDRLASLRERPSLEDVFRRLLVRQDLETRVTELVQAMKR